MKNYLLPILFLVILSCNKTEASLPPQKQENSNVSQVSSPQTNVQTQTIIFRDAQGNILTESQKDSIVQNTKGIQALRSFNDNTTEYILFKTFDDLRGFVPDDVVDNLIREDKLRKSGGPAQVFRQRLLDKWQNQPLPEKKFSLMNGEEKSFSDYFGSMLVVNFWYTTCGPCIIEMPALNQLVDDYKESDINFLSFSFDKKEDLEINVKDDMDALVQGEDLSEEFKTKASTIFEAAVSAKVLSEVNQRIEELETNYKKEISEAKEEHLSTITEKVDGYLNYVCEEWMKENELAVEKGIRSELVEDFMTGLKNLFTEHYIDIPEEKVDLVDDLFEKVEELEQKLDESINTSVDIKKELAEYRKAETLREVSEDLADTEKEKLGKLAEGIDFEDKSQYSEKLEVIKENYFPKQQSETITEELENTEVEEQNSSEPDVDPVMKRYVSSLTRLNK